MLLDMLDVLGSESGTLQVRTSNSRTRREDEKKNFKGIRQLNQNSSALLQHTRPPAVWQVHNKFLSNFSGLQFIQLTKTLWRLSLLLQVDQLQEWIIVRLLRSDSIMWGLSPVLIRPASIWGGFPCLSELDTVSVCVFMRKSTLTHVSTFSLWLLLPQNKYVLIGTHWHHRVHRTFLSQAQLRIEWSAVSREKDKVCEETWCILQPWHHCPCPCCKDFTKIRENGLEISCKGQSGDLGCKNVLCHHCNMCNDICVFYMFFVHLICINYICSLLGNLYFVPWSDNTYAYGYEYPDVFYCKLFTCRGGWVKF